LKGGISLSVEIGNYLRKKRESFGISVEQLARQTGIAQEDILSLEKGAFDLFPSSVYVRSYLRSYAKAVGENPQMILEQYVRSMAKDLQKEHETRSLKYTKSGAVVLQQKSAPTLLRRSNYNANGKRRRSSFGRFYDWLLLIGGLTLVIATIAYIWYIRL
jgi:predicted transcriptional regulator